MDKKFQSKSIQEFHKFVQYFPFESDDDVSIILKGHLLIEELLVSFMSKKMKKPEELKNFRFYHYLCLARALEEKSDNNWIWAATEKLNSIRNKLAHNLQPAGLGEFKEEFIRIVGRERIEFPVRLVKKFGEFKIAVLTLHQVLAFHLHVDYKY